MEYLEEMLSYMGFEQRLISLIHECIMGFKLSILINGSPSMEFGVHRGLRQGNPLSPFLFDIAVEGLSVLFKRASNSGLCKRINCGNGMHLSHLQYVDDTLVFSPNDFHSISTAKRNLRWFELASGLKVNFHKNSLVGINLDDEYTTGMKNAIYCKWDFPWEQVRNNSPLRNL
jgi:mannosylglycoprotein endo-beta-mannosidase